MKDSIMYVSPDREIREMTVGRIYKGRCFTASSGASFYIVTNDRGNLDVFLSSRFIKVG